MTELLRPSQLAAELGVRKWSIYRAIRLGHFPATRLPNGQLRIARSDVALVLEAGRIVPQREPGEVFADA